MMHFTVEEENLICMYHTSDRRRTMAQQTLFKLKRMTDSDYDSQKFYFTDENE